MGNQTVSSMIGTAPMAFSAALGQHLLGTSVQEILVEAADLAAGGDVKIDRGERFAVTRGVAVVPLRGMLTPNFFALEKYFGWTTYHGLEQTAQELAGRDDVKAIVIESDTPGGFVLGIDAASNAIAALSKIKPVHVLVNPMAASAGYWIASQATEIVMTGGSVVGSIGIAALASSATKPDMFGDKWFQIASGHASSKRPDPATDKGLAEIKRDIDDIEADFHAAVAAGRGISVDELPKVLTVTDDVADGGAVFRPAEALRRGLADRQMTRSEFYADMFAKYAPAQTRKSSKAFAAKAQAAKALSTI